MKFRAGTDVAFGVSDLNAAKQFYTEIFGFETGRTMGNCQEVKAGPIDFWLVDDQEHEPCFVIEVDDIESSCAGFFANGCTKIDWVGNEGEIFVRDPFGYAWCVEKRKG